MERICIDTLHSLFYGYPSMRVPPESRMVVKRFPRHPCLSLWERWPAQRGRRGQITATSIGKCWHLRRQMTSRGRKALSVTCGDSSPKGGQGIVYWHKKWSVSVSIRSIHCLRLPLNARAARKSDGRKTVSVPAPLASPCGRGTARTEGRQITATSIGKCWHLRRQMTSRGRKALSVTCGDSSPKGEPRHRILAQEMERICIDTLHSLFYGYPSMRVPPESRMVVKRFPSRHPLPLPVGEVAQQRGRRRANNGNVNRKMLAPSQADDVPRAQGPLSHLR